MIANIKVLCFLLAFCSLGLVLSCKPSSSNTEQSKQADESTANSNWVKLLDTNLSKWENYLSYRHQLGYSGKKPLDKLGKEVIPIGYNNDQTKVFSVVDKDGEKVLRVSGEIYGSLYTKEEFSNYHLKLKVKWGTKKFSPREKLLKDSGILYHSIGESGVDYWRAWMLSQELQSFKVESKMGH